MKRMKSGDKIPTLAGTEAEVPFANEITCFGQRQDWCKNMATWRMEGPHLILHWCDKCKERFNKPNNIWTKLDLRSSN